MFLTIESWSARLGYIVEKYKEKYVVCEAIGNKIGEFKNKKEVINIILEKLRSEYKGDL